MLNARLLSSTPAIPLLLNVEALSNSDADDRAALFVDPAVLAGRVN